MHIRMDGFGFDFHGSMADGGTQDKNRGERRQGRGQRTEDRRQRTNR